MSRRFRPGPESSQAPYRAGEKGRGQPGDRVGPYVHRPLALARLAAGDTLGAIRLAMQGVGRHALDPAAHALLADLTLPRPRERSSVAIEALACRVLAPGDAAAWKRWGKVQIALGRYEQARRSFDRYVVLGGSTAATDPEVQRWLSQIARVLPGGDVARAALRGGGGAR